MTCDYKYKTNTNTNTKNPNETNRTFDNESSHILLHLLGPFVLHFSALCSGVSNNEIRKGEAGEHTCVGECGTLVCLVHANGSPIVARLLAFRLHLDACKMD